MRETDPNYLRACEKYQEDPSLYPLGDPAQVNLYDFTALFHKNWKYRGTVKIVVPTPQVMGTCSLFFLSCSNELIVSLQFYIVPRQSLEEYYNLYCETTLLLFLPGANDTNFLHKNLQDPNSELYLHPHEALYDFVFDDQSACPEMIREEFKMALRREAGEEVQPDVLDVDQLVLSPLVEDDELETLDEDVLGLVRPQEDMTTEEQEDEIMAIEDDVGASNLMHNADHNWAEDTQTLELSDERIDEAQGWIKLQKTINSESSGDTSESNAPATDPASLNQNQRWVYDAAMGAIHNPTRQELLDVCGGAGTGKSYTINTILEQTGLEYPDQKVVQIISPTGAASKQFTSGKTIHSYLKIGVKGNRKGKETQFNELSDVAAQQLERDLSDLRLLIIDEKGMIGFTRLFQIDSRLRQARPEHRMRPFGGISVMLAGDLRQLPPVFDMALYEVPTSSALPMESHGFQLYRLFDRQTFKLCEQMRQTGDRNAAFRKDLDDLAVNNFTEDTYYRWKSFMNPITMSAERWKDFKDHGIMLAGRKKDLHEFNERRLLDLKKPVYMSSAINNPKTVKKLDSAEAGGLLDTIFLAKGCRILLTRNLWTEKGLVNGSDGIVEYIIFKSTTDFTKSPPPLPDVLLVRFPGYQGPSFLADKGIEGIVPIVPMTHYGMESNKSNNFSRTQHPLLPGYGITIHKAQGDLLAMFL